jgi:hypothetical protein
MVFLIYEKTKHGRSIELQMLPSLNFDPVILHALLFMRFK